jgi:hypothetical protein
METVEKHVQLSVEHAQRLHELAQTYQISEDQVIEKALDTLSYTMDVANSETTQDPEELFKQRLRELGLLQDKGIRRTRIGTGNPQLIQVKGKPLSEIIIEERR